eukprot:2917025-Pyramimonas_sp.AAC.1
MPGHRNPPPPLGQSPHRCPSSEGQLEGQRGGEGEDKMDAGGGRTLTSCPLLRIEEGYSGIGINCRRSARISSFRVVAPLTAPPLARSARRGGGV